MRIGSDIATPKQERRPATILGVVLVLVELVFSGHLTVFGLPPHFMLVLTAALALTFGSRAGCVSGFCLGMLVDLLGSGPVGLSALLYCAGGYLLGRSERNVFADGWRAPTLAMAVLSLACNVLYLVLLFFTGTSIGLAGGVVGTVVASTLVDAAIGAIVMAIMARVYSSGQLSSRALH